MRTITWKKLRSMLEGKVSQQSLDIIKRITSHVRRRDRVNEVISRALNHFSHLPWEKRKLAAFWLLDEEAQGLYGGGWVLPGASSLRHPIFKDLPPHNTESGAAWDEALRLAAVEVLREAYVLKYRPLRLESEGVTVFASEVFDPEAHKTVLKRRLMNIVEGIAQGHNLEEAIEILQNLEELEESEQPDQAAESA